MTALIVVLALLSGALLTFVVLRGQRAQSRRDASAPLGRPQLAGVTVATRGSARAQAQFVGGGLIFRDRRDGADAPDFGAAGWLVATAEKLALIRLEKGGFAGIAARCPSGDVASVALGGASRGGIPVTVTFTDGARWTLEASVFSGSRARRLAEVVNGWRSAARP